MQPSQSVRGFDVSEALRFLLVALLAIVAWHPLITPNQVGGVDARWYAQVSQDAVLQAREGQFPAFQGGTKFDHVGGVHPHRSAPMHLMLCQGIDALTLHRQSIFMVEHLALLLAAVAGAVSMYAACRKLSPAHPWSAVCFAALYTLTPSITALLSRFDAYMSFTATAFLPWVLYGNVIARRTGGERGYVCLSIALVGTWMSHPPIGMLATLLSIVLQCGTLSCSARIPWGSLTRGAAVFGGLGAYYFLSMSEIPRDPYEKPLQDLLVIVGAATGWIGLNRALRGHGKVWLLLWLLGVAIAARGLAAWGAWLALVGLITLTFVAVIHFRKRRPAPLGMILGLAALLSAAALPHLIPVGFRTFSGWYERSFSADSASLWLKLVSLPTRYPANPNLYPGLGITLLLPVALYFAIRGKASDTRSLLWGLLAAAICGLNVPAVSDFILHYFPPYLAAMCNLPLQLRIMPVFTTTMLVCAATALPHLESTWSRRILLTLALGLVAPLGWINVHHLYAVRSTEAASMTLFRDDSRPTPTFHYQLAALPTHYNWGVTDPRVESRLRDPATNRVLVGPDEIAAQMEAKGTRSVVWEYPALPEVMPGPVIPLRPRLTVAPGEAYFIRAEFAEDNLPSGVWVMRGNGFYREYHLPSAGNPDAFGASPRASRVITLWNDGSEPLDLEQEIWYDSGMQVRKAGARIGTLTFSTFEPASSPLRLKSYLPYVIEVTTATEAVLETFRTWLPGYRATVDGVEAPIVMTLNHLIGVRVPTGTHTITVTHHITPRLFAGLVITCTSLLVLIVIWIRRLIAGARPVVATP